MDTKFVYIDSSIFVEKNFNFSGREFEALMKFAKDEKISLIIPSITVDEVESNIKKEIEISIQSIKKLRRNAKVLRNFSEYPISHIFDLKDENSYKDILFRKFINYLKSCNATILDIESANVNRIFDLYFNKNAPFGEGKKKNEFPDAFILSTLSSFAFDEQKNIYVVSGDKDFEKATEYFWGLSYLSSLEAYLELATSHYEKLAPLAIKLIKENRMTIISALSEHFTDMGFYLGDQNGEVYGVKVVEIKGIEEFLIGVDECSAEFDISANVIYSANLLYDNMETAAYDSEEKALIPHEKIDIILDRSEKIQANVSITFSTDEPYDFRLETIDILSPQDDVEIQVEDHYKY